MNKVVGGVTPFELTTKINNQTPGIISEAIAAELEEEDKNDGEGESPIEQYCLAKKLYAGRSL